MASVPGNLVSSHSKNKKIWWLESYGMRSFIIYTPCEILLAWSDKGGRDGQDM
jgi:hypothetical protein